MCTVYSESYHASLVHHVAYLYLGLEGEMLS